MGVLGVKNAKIWISYQTAGSIGTNFGTHVHIHLEMVMGEITITPCDLEGIWGVLGVRKSKIRNNYQTDGPIGTHVRIHLVIYILDSRQVSFSTKHIRINVERDGSFALTN